MTNRKLLLLTLAVAGFSAWLFHDRLLPAGQKPTIKLIGEAYAPLEALVKMAPAFEAESGYKLEVTEKDHQSVVAELDQQMASDSIAYDVILMPHRLIGRLVEKDRLIPLDQLVDPSSELLAPTDTNLRWWKEVSWYKNKAYGAPFSFLTMYVAYRKDLMEDPSNQSAFQAKFGRPLKVPATWKEYEDLASFFNRPEQGLYGTYIQGQQHVALWYEWLNVMYAHGADVLAPNNGGTSYGRVVVDSVKAREATNAMLRLLSFSPPESTNYNWDDALAVLQSGKAFMGMMWHDATPYLEDPKQCKFAGKFGYFPIPSTTGKPISQLEGWSYLIPKGAPNPKAAAQFIQWALSKNPQLEQTKKGGASPRTSVYKDPSVAAIAYIPTYLNLFDAAVAKPTFPESGAITEALVRRLSAIINRQTTVDEGLTSAASDLTAILAKHPSTE